ncbi:hypothetical protein O4H49_06940 [Kiloniella laminariae]|uniref:Glycosylase n=1 Tax=Kiloniella laminariae TaxID=454162 RepID=A0ABT4LHC7_9PROT|nr:hypothetical protein [Kiloniella laminariae]MCZ4280506.1 hypothetical protein [Kiloniella laminariae]
MRWVKRGKIFDPTDHKLPNGCTQFAQSPQALVFDDYIRIYFSTRVVDKQTAKYLSHVAFVDMDKNFKEIIKVSDQTVLPLGELGCFDEHGIFPMNVVRWGDLVYGYTCGWSRRRSVSVETGIGLAVSDDSGLTFQRYGKGPILSASLREPSLVGDGFVKVVNGVFHMWYMFGTGWKEYTPNTFADRTYKIGHAVSKDGINWQKEEGRQIIVDQLGQDESQALPSVVEIEGRFHMLFCYRHSFDFRQNKNRGYRLGHAYSDDLKNWIRDDDMLTPGIGGDGEWDSEMQCYPHVFDCDGNIFLLYNGNEFGRCGFGLAVLER